METYQVVLLWIYAIPAGFGLVMAFLAGIMTLGYAQDDSKNTKGIHYVAEALKVLVMASLAALAWPVYVPAQIYKDHS